MAGVWGREGYYGVAGKLGWADPGVQPFGHFHGWAEGGAGATTNIIRRWDKRVGGGCKRLQPVRHTSGSDCDPGLV